MSRLLSGVFEIPAEVIADQQQAKREAEQAVTGTLLGIGDGEIVEDKISTLLFAFSDSKKSRQLQMSIPTAPRLQELAIPSPQVETPPPQ